jgi:pSer/pThr/pTyr-binding forkhead associated (FHA) protein
MTESSENEHEVDVNAYLVINAQIFPIKHKVTRIGRKFDNDLVLQDLSISRYHAEIVFENNKFMLVDKESSGGTFLNNQKVDKTVLYSGDIISLSSTPIMFMNENENVRKRSEIDTSTLND